MRKPKPLALLQQLKIRACEMRTQAMYFRAEADRLEECIRLLSPRVQFAKTVIANGTGYIHGLIMGRNETKEEFEARVVAYSEEQTRKVKR